MSRNATVRAALVRARRVVRARTAPRVEPLSPPEALRENGFTVFRGAFSRAECATLARAMKAEAGIEDGTRYTRLDAANKLPSTRDVLFDRRVLQAVRTAVGADVRFLQVSDLHYRHDTFGWHRDSVHRAHDSSEAPDWSDTGTPFGVVKAILYLESENAAMGIMAGSHLTPIEMDRAHVKQVEQRDGQLVIGGTENPNRRLSDAQRDTPLACRLEVGDLLVFDERLYHAGRRVERGLVSNDQASPKFTLSLVFGLDNEHSERMYSYFRYARQDLPYLDVRPELHDRLVEHDLVMRNGWTNYYERRPDDLRFAYLRDPDQLEPLMAAFARAGSGGKSSVNG